MGTLTVAAQEDVTTEDNEPTEQPVKKPKVEAPKKHVATRVVTGCVINAATKSPMPGALVRTQEIDGYSALTEDDGTYEIRVT